jgi:hypothetical protein
MITQGGQPDAAPTGFNVFVAFDGPQCIDSSPSFPKQSKRGRGAGDRMSLESKVIAIAKGTQERPLFLPR